MYMIIPKASYCNRGINCRLGGIFKLRVKFMKLFVNYVRDIVSRDEKAVFLLNRFHLSAYAMTIIQQPKLEKEYDEILNVLRTLPVHVFILRLEASEIEKRSLHPERSGAWLKFQQQIVKKEGFRDRLERYTWQQRLMLEAAEQTTYTLLDHKALAPETGEEWVRVPGRSKHFSSCAHGRMLLRQRPLTESKSSLEF